MNQNTKKTLVIIAITVVLTSLYFVTALLSYQAGKKAGKRDAVSKGSAFQNADGTISRNIGKNARQELSEQDSLESDLSEKVTTEKESSENEMSEKETTQKKQKETQVTDTSQTAKDKKEESAQGQASQAGQEDGSGNGAEDRQTKQVQEQAGNRSQAGQVQAATDQAGQGQATNDQSAGQQPAQTMQGNVGQNAVAGSPLALHGKLSVSGIDLVDEHHQPFQLKGVSTHGLQWYPQYVNLEGFRTLRDDWQANAVRLSMYTGEGGYMTGASQAALEAKIDEGVNACTELGMYCIIDWHILSDGNPNQYKEGAKEFFGKMSEKYRGHVNVLYEICNEPNGGVSWQEIKSYADEVIAVIRGNDRDAIIIVGTPTWSQDVDVVASAPVADSHNVMYALHFYAATHKEQLRDKLVTARNNQIPVIISEFSICEASGNGSIDYDSAGKWWDLIRSANLSYFGWNLSNKNEACALIAPSCSKTAGYQASELSETGKWLRSRMRGE